MGVFFDATDLGAATSSRSIMCCTGNGSQAIYYAWEGIIQEKGNGVVQVNLIMNRFSPWIDILSYLPYEGKVVLKNKSAEEIFIRMPDWVNKKKGHL